MLFWLLKITTGFTLGKKFKIVLGFFLFFSLSLNASEHKLKIVSLKNKNYISQKSLVKNFKWHHSFEPTSGKGKLYHKNHYAIYKQDFSFLIIDGLLIKEKYPTTRKKGEILIPLFLAQKILESFYPNIKIKKKKSYLCYSYNKKKSVSKRTPAQKIKSNEKDRIKFIIIDPGHGGKDPGALAKNGLPEKKITLKIGKDLKSILKKKTKGITLKLTRGKDIFVSLAKRTDLANQYLKQGNNGLFISIHANASLSKKISGFETYFLSQNPTNEDARNTATLENNVITLEKKQNLWQKSFADINYLEANMLTTQIQKESSLLAESIQNNLDKKINKFKSRGVHKADFFVLRGALMPAVLVEVGFITHPKERIYLNKRYYQKKLAAGIAEGIISFLKKYNSIKIR